MSIARPYRLTEDGVRLRILRGKRVRKVTLAPWMVMILVGVIAFFGLVFARTSLDKSAFDLAALDAAIEEQIEINRELEIEIARLENPARIAPLAEEMGLVIPTETHQLLVDLDRSLPAVAQVQREGS